MPVPNFRDFGGYPSRLGGQVVADRLYRSGGVANARPDAVDALAAYDFELIVDLRYVLEQAHEPSPWPDALRARVLAHDSNRQSAAPHLLVLENKATDPAMVDLHFTTYYRDLPFDARYRPMFGRVLTRMADAQGRILVHCTAGKDRTGLIVALTHHILGVEPDEAMADFLLSSQAKGFSDQAEAWLPSVREQYGYDVPVSVLQRLLGVQPEWLNTSFEEIRRVSGSVDAYLDEMGVDHGVRERLRQRYLVR
ncbi:MAG: tyrosine-protein phosphatase [Sphingobium sp.]